MASDETVTLEGVKCIASTEKAALCTGGPLSSREIWFPVSQIDDNSEVFHKGNEGKLIITLWIAQQKELVDEDGDLIEQKPAPKTRSQNLKDTAKKAASKSKKKDSKTGKCKNCGKPCKPQYDTCWGCKSSADESGSDDDQPVDVMDIE